MFYAEPCGGAPKRMRPGRRVIACRADETACSGRRDGQRKEPSLHAFLLFAVRLAAGAFLFNLIRL
jgi:hypothetical protein